MTDRNSVLIDREEAAKVADEQAMYWAGTGAVTRAWLTWQGKFTLPGEAA